jgi:putative ABC transport system permease protein
VNRWAGTRAAVRMARRDALRNRGRSLLVVVMIALPVLALSGADVLARTMQLSTTEKINRSMGQADATAMLAGTVVHQTASLSAGGWTADGAMLVPGTTAYAAAKQRLLRALPPGSRLVDRVRSSGPAGTATRTGGLTASDIEIDGIDLRDPITTGLARVTRGRPAATTGEVALTPSLAKRLSVHIGADVTIRHHRLRVVGEVHNPQAVHADMAYLLPNAFGPGDAAETSFFISSPRPIRWADVKRLNQIGVAVDSRDVLEHPPAGVPIASSSTLAARARSIGIATVAVGLAVLEVVLLAGATFAVGARRQRRDLALVAAAGGDERAVRRVVLSAGGVLGAAGAVGGVALGVIAARFAVPVVAGLADADAGHFDLRPLELLAVAVLGVATGVAAAVLPARAAAREDVVAALTGRRGVVATARRVPVIGLGMIVFGAAAAAYAAHPPARFTLVLAGAVIAEIGFVVCAPAVVGGAGRVARRLPLTLRLAVRDASRHRARTGPAVAAVLAAVAGSIAMSTWIASTTAEASNSYQPQLRVGQTGIQVSPDPKAPKDRGRQLLGMITRDLPATAATPLSTSDCFSGRCRRTVVAGAASADCTDPATTPCADAIASWTVAVGDSTVLDQVLGHHDAAATAALARGDLVVLDHRFIRDGKATLVTTPVTGGDGVRQVVPAHLVDAGRAGWVTGAMLAPAAAATLHLQAQPWGYLLTTTHLPTQTEVDRAQADLGELSASVIVERGYQRERWNYGLLALTAAAALVTLGATAIATALSAADSRPDLVTLAAVGAGPGLRRRFAAGQAATVATLGTALGVLAGLIPAWAVIHAHGSIPFAMPWQQVALVAVGVPLLAAAATGTLTRSRLSSERRAT